MAPAIEILLYLLILPLFPLALFVIPRMPNRFCVVLIHLIYGLAMNFILFGMRAFFAVALMLFGYAIIQGPHPLVVLVVVMAVNTFVHLWHLVNCTRSWSLEVTATCLMMFQRIVSLSFNLRDGKSEKAVRGVCEGYRLSRRPDAIEIFAFFITPFGGTTGPCYEFCYFDWMLDAPHRPRTEWGSPVRKRAIMYYLLSFAQAGVSLWLSPYCTIEFYHGEFYMGAPWAAKLVLMVLVSLFWAGKYYVTWYAVQAALVESGIGDCPFGKEEDWSNMTIWWFLESLSMAEWFQRWNHSTHLFWKNYLYFRVLNAGGPRWIGRALVFVFSSAWHGLKPSYYLVLPEVLLFMWGDRKLLKKFPMSKTDPLWKRLIRHVYVIIGMFSSASGWWFGSFEAYWHIHTSHYFGPAVVGAVLYTIVLFLPNAKRETEVKKTE
jgi:hypothetical protein